MLRDTLVGLIEPMLAWRVAKLAVTIVSSYQRSTHANPQPSFPFVAGRPSC